MHTHTYACMHAHTHALDDTAVKNSLEIIIKQMHLEGGFKRGGMKQAVASLGLFQVWLPIVKEQGECRAPVQGVQWICVDGSKAGFGSQR